MSRFERYTSGAVIDASKTSILGNLILLGSPPDLNSFPHSPSLAALLARYTLSLALTRSSSLSVLEDRLDTQLNSVSIIPRDLARSGAQPMGRRAVIRKLGELMVLRMAVNTRGGGLYDTPEVGQYCRYPVTIKGRGADN